MSKTLLITVTVFIATTSKIKNECKFMLSTNKHWFTAGNLV